jgi:hypothetical protein
MAGGEQSLDPRTRIMNALGSKANGANLVLTIKSINSVKNKVWGATYSANRTQLRNYIQVLMHHAYKDAKDMKDLVEKEDPTAAFMFIRTVRYLSPKYSGGVLLTRIKGYWSHPLYEPS